jgi:hypothetical protein
VHPAASTTTERLFALVHRSAGVRLYAEEPELRAAPLIAASEGQSAAALMDAVAALWLVRWEKDVRGMYKLLPSEAEANIHLPKNRFQQERAGPGRDFAANLRRLPRELRAALLSGRPVAAAALPGDMLQSIGRMTDSINREQELKGDDNPFPLGRLPQSSIRLDVQNRGTYNSYFLSLSLAGWGSMGWRFSDYEEAPAKGSGKSSNPIYAPRKLEIKREQALEMPALRKLVSIRAKNASLPEILRDLRVPFVSSPEFALQQRADVNIQSEALGAALDKLTKTYTGTEWEYRKLGFLVVRSATNPARNAPADEPHGERESLGPKERQ